MSKLPLKYKERIFEQNINNDGELCVLVDYYNSLEVLVCFSDGTEVIKEYSKFKNKKGKCVIKNPAKLDKLYEQNINPDGELCVITEYKNSLDMIFCFSDGTEIKSYYHHFKDKNGRCSLINPNKYISRLYEQNINKDYELCVIVEYNNSMDIVVSFSDGFLVKTSYANFKTVTHPQKYIDRIFQQKTNNFDELVVIIEYNSCSDVLVSFSDGTEIRCEYSQFNDKNGNCRVTNPNTYCLTTSKGEIELRNFIKENVNQEIIYNDRNILDGQELDIYIPNLNLAFEYNGLYWHSEKFIDKNYHINKSKYCYTKKIRLIHIFEDEWLNKKEILKSRILNILNKTKHKIYARKCITKKINYNEAKEFLNSNHIQGKVNGVHFFGLFHEKELVSVMSFGELNPYNGFEKKDNFYELSRFSNKLNTNVIGGASKLLKYFERNYNPKKIISFADRCWGVGELYFLLGFSSSHLSSPNYTYFLRNELIRHHKYKFNKRKLISLGFDSNKTEANIMLDLGYLKIYDCGKIHFYKEYENTKEIKPYIETLSQQKSTKLKNKIIELGNKYYIVCDDKIKEAKQLENLSDKFNKIKESPNFREIQVFNI